MMDQIILLLLLQCVFVVTSGMVCAPHCREDDSYRDVYLEATILEMLQNKTGFELIYQAPGIFNPPTPCKRVTIDLRPYLDGSALYSAYKTLQAQIDEYNKLAEYINQTKALCSRYLSAEAAHYMKSKMSYAMIDGEKVFILQGQTNFYVDNSTLEFQPVIFDDSLNRFGRFAEASGAKTIRAEVEHEKWGGLYDDEAIEFVFKKVQNMTYDLKNELSANFTRTVDSIFNDHVIPWDLVDGGNFEKLATFVLGDHYTHSTPPFYKKFGIHMIKLFRIYPVSFLRRSDTDRLSTFLETMVCAPKISPDHRGKVYRKMKPNGNVTEGWVAIYRNDIFSAVELDTTNCKNASYAMFVCPSMHTFPRYPSYQDLHFTKRSP